MKPSTRKLLVLTSGGDAPGMNAAVRAVVRTALHHGIDVWGCRRGFQGLVDRDIFPLTADSVANCIQRGGTLLKTARCHSFLEKSTRDRCRAYLTEMKVTSLVAIGGDGTFQGALKLEEEGGPASVGIPGTIDNDISGSDYTIGFDTARNTALEAIDKIRDTASSHDRNFIVEVMGRKTGFLAMDVGIAGGAEMIVTPEFGPSMDEIVERVMRPRREKQSSIIVVTEGDRPGRSMDMARELQQRTKQEYRVCILGHMQRGGKPTAMDRKVASCMGALAVTTLLEGKSKQMMVMIKNDIATAPYPSPGNARRFLTDRRLEELSDLLAT